MGPNQTDNLFYSKRNLKKKKKKDNLQNGRKQFQMMQLTRAYSLKGKNHLYNSTTKEATT